MTFYEFFYDILSNVVNAPDLTTVIAHSNTTDPIHPQMSKSVTQQGDTSLFEFLGNWSLYIAFTDSSRSFEAPGNGHVTDNTIILLLLTHLKNILFVQYVCDNSRLQYMKKENIRWACDVAQCGEEIAGNNIVSLCFSDGTVFVTLV